MRDVVVRSIEHPQSGVSDFYRELGDLFAVDLRPHNRWAGFKALRERWKAHAESSLLRPVLLVDEAQEMGSAVLSELRMLSSGPFDFLQRGPVVPRGLHPDHHLPRPQALARLPDVSPRPLRET